MKQLLVVVAAVVLLLWVPATAQTRSPAVDQWRDLVPFSDLQTEVPGLTLRDYEQVLRSLASEVDSDYLGRLSANPYLPDSTSNRYGQYGHRFGNTLRNPYGRYGSRYSPTSPANPYAVNPPRLFGHDGTYLGKLGDNRYDPESTANPYGRYGSPYSPDSINNPYGVYGSPYSPLSPNNPYTVTPPLIFGGDPW